MKVGVGERKREERSGPVRVVVGKWREEDEEEKREN